MSRCCDEPPVIKHRIFVQKMAGSIPKPPSFKNGFNGKEFTVPQYYPFEHSETQWILNMYKSASWERLQRIALINPSYFRNSYFQIPDSPDPLYGPSMFHERAVMYLTPLALAVYLNLDTIVRNLIEFRDQNGYRVLNIYQPCYVTNVFINSADSINDLLQIYSPCILILRQSFDCIRTMLIDGKWSPLKPFSFLYRRPFKICKFSYKDIIDYSISQLLLKNNFQLPQLLNSMISSLSDEFSLLYYEQIISQYYQHQIEEWVSIPRRLLRIAFYYDKDMRLTSQIVRCIQVFQKNSFFIGPTKSCFQILYKQRLHSLKLNFHRKLSNPDETRVVLDQDNCFSLIFGLIHHASVYRHTIIKEKLMNIVPYLANDTMWILHFLCKEAKELSYYFSNLIEKVDCISEYIFLQIKSAIIKLLETRVISIDTFKDLNLKPNETISIETVISQFSFMYAKKLGHSSNNCNNIREEDNMEDFSHGNCIIEDFENEEEESELEKFINSSCVSEKISKRRRKKNIRVDVIQLLEQDAESI